MTTVNKPILLDETGKDIASAVREQTQALKTAIQSISVGGGGGSADCGYLPKNMTVVPSTISVPIESDGVVTVGTAIQVYNPATDDFPPPKYMIVHFFLDDGVTRPKGARFSVATGSADEVGFSTGDDIEMAYMLAIEFQESLFGVGSNYIPLPYSEDKPIWLRCIDLMADNHISEMVDSIVFELYYD